MKQVGTVASILTLRVLSALASVLVVAALGMSSGFAAQANAAPTAASYKLYDLGPQDQNGAGILQENAVNHARVAVTLACGTECDAPGIWSGGTLTQLPLPQQSGYGTQGYDGGLTDSGTVVGAVDPSDSTVDPGLLWSSPTAGPTTFANSPGNVVAFPVAGADGSLAYSVGVGDGGTRAYYSANLGQSSVPLPLGNCPNTNATTSVALGAGGGRVLWGVSCSGASTWFEASASTLPAVTTLDFDACSLASNGTIVGRTANGSTGILRTPNGTESPIPILPGTICYGSFGNHYPDQVNSSGDVIGTAAGVSSLYDGTTVTPISSLFPSNSGWSNETATAIDDQGDIVGSGQLNGVPHGFLLAGSGLNPPVVNSTGDAPAANPSGGSCDTGKTVADASGTQVPECTLRAAIQAVDAGQATTTEITFAIPAGAAGPIKLGGPLPALTAAGAVIDGTSQPGGSANVDGTALAAKGSCVTVQAGGVTVQGLDLTNCPTGIDLGAPGLDKVQGDVIGLTPAGAAAPGGHGVLVESGSAGNLIGGVQPSLRDVISAQGNGITLSGPHNLVEGDYLGTDTNGAGFVPNQLGVLVGSTGNTVGGATASPGTGAGNVIVAGDPKTHFVYGVIVFGTGGTVAGNLIGTNASGNQLYAPTSGNAARDQVLVAAPAVSTVIGGGLGSGNVIAGAAIAQIELDGATAVATQVVGNTIGVGVNRGALPTPGATGILDAAASSPRIGLQGDGNTIAGQKYGVVISGQSDEIDYSTTEIVDGQPTVQTYVFLATDAAAKVTNASVRNNVIGALPGGEAAPSVPQQIGVLDDSGTSDEIGPRNQISFNDVGVQLHTTTKTQVAGNQIGTDRLGFTAIPNGIGVKVIGGEQTEVGLPPLPDTISGNLLGVLLAATDKAKIQGEKIGTDTRGNAALKPYNGAIPASMEQAVHAYGKGGIELHASDDTLIGGDTTPESVTVGATDGVGIDASGPTFILKDRIGVTAGRHAPLPNRGNGIDASADTQIADSVIAHSDKVGVQASGSHAPLIVGTTIYDNRHGGIKDLTHDAPRAPKLTSAVNRSYHGQHLTDISLEVDVPRHEKGLLELFASSSCQAHGAGEKQVGGDDRFNGHATISTVIDTVPVGTAITALLTTTPHTTSFALATLEDHVLGGRTSVFSDCIRVKPGT